MYKYIFPLSAELAQKARKEIADYITLGKEDRARIRVGTHASSIYNKNCIIKLIFRGCLLRKWFFGFKNAVGNEIYS